MFCKCWTVIQLFSVFFQLEQKTCSLFEWYERLIKISIWKYLKWYMSSPYSFPSRNKFWIWMLFAFEIKIITGFGIILVFYHCEQLFSFFSFALRGGGAMIITHLFQKKFFFFSFFDFLLYANYIFSPLFLYPNYIVFIRSFSLQ